MAAAQIADITDEAGVAPGTFYVHFKDKEALASELLDDFNEGFLRALQGRFEGAESTEPGRLIDAAADVFVGYWWRNRRTVRALVDVFAAQADPRSMREGFSPELVEFLRALLESRSVGPGQARLVTHGLLGMWLRVGLQFVFEKEEMKDLYRGTLVEMTRGVLERMIRM